MTPPSDAAVRRRPGRPPAAGQRARRSGPAADLRERLLDSAVALFGERGVAGTTTAQIAARCGATGAMVHYYFRARAQLIDAVVDERLMPFVAAVWGPLDEQALARPAAAVIGLATRLLDAAASRPWLPPLWIREIASAGGELRERMLSRLPKDRMAALAQAVAAAQQDGKIHRGIEPQLLFIWLLGLTLLPLATEPTWQRVVPRPGAARAGLRGHVQALLERALRPDPEAS